MGEAAVAAPGKCQKSYFDVLGICCPSEVPLVEKLLQPLPGIQKVTVIVPSRTVIVVHDTDTTSPSQIVKVLNQARLEASVRAYGSGAEKITNKWPSPYVLICGVFLVVSLFEHFWHPLKWSALVAAATGLPPIILRSIAAARRLTLDVNILMLIAVSGAIALKDYSEAGFIVFLFTTAEWLETRASRKATAGMSSLLSMTPQKAVLAETGQVVAAQDVNVNTVIAVKAGEIVPIDGVVVDGRSEVDESTLTGESFPVAKQPESQVWAGTLNIDGYIAVRTTAMSDNSAVAKMARLVEEAQNSRSNTQRLIDTCAKYYTPAVVVMAAAVAVIPVAVRAHNLKHWFQLALVLLVSACPCALVLSTPVATFCALLRAARTGLLIKGGDVLESLAKIKVAAFDKTGTITRGEFCVEEFQAVGRRVPMQQLLYWVSSIESRSSHPMASVLVDYAQSKSVEPKSDNVTEFQIYPGEGIYGEIDREGVYIGNKRILSRASCEAVPDMKDMKGVTIVYVACKKELIGVFTLSDSCRTGSAEAIKELSSLGIKSVMLTGDSAAAAAYAQNQLGNILEEVHSELLPEEKMRIVDELKAKHGPTLMIGDGMNDAPALAKADVGVSMGVSGSAVAMETSHITLMSNDIRRIPKAVQLARRTHRTIIVNIIFSVITKLAIVGLALAGHPLIWAAVLADVGTCLLVIMYSMLLLREKDGRKAKKCCASSQHGSHTKKHCVSRHCSDGPCMSTGGCKKSCSPHSAAGKHASDDHGHSHNRCKEPSNQQLTEKHACHDHGHSLNHCKEPSNQMLTEKHACHDHGHTHSHCKEQGNQLLIENHACHDHCKELSSPRFTNKHDCHDHEHNHCKEPNTSHSGSEGACHDHEHSHCEEHNHSHPAGEHAFHGHEHSHCKEPIALHSTGEHACHDHDHEHHCHAEQQTLHTAYTHHCHDHDHDHDHVEIEESRKDCHAELQHHHSHCCHEPHDHENSAAASVQQHSISIDAPSEDHEQHSHHAEEHKEEDCGSHLKVKDCAPSTDCVSKTCCSITSSKGCGSKDKDICSSWQVVCAREASRCCRSYVKCPSTSSCCSHSILKLPEIVVE
ncbi:cadmium/zinc-transporting ATPase HMA2-like [Phragmites australis]|uniref:cadmium/zinc-transporting ATPase HMA2-like n=1 Tax=Phragmites australis TaxID=29695 RepID=UPI002D793F05|nr:cadmium/zinc-transporting ATPase HMA2-like [Phragmites australis]XP_062234225.1 cadmium/zinc-transporting ATPase HMA2-like [Phragmites australis]XP_062234226.1 cadmium/zinc-transporting ATPase HMA2-like [Phragmites australis]